MFRDRRDAGRQLASRLSKLDIQNPVVIGLPRGGVVVAAEVARVLRAPLDIMGVRKLGTPGQPELAMGAIAEEGVIVYNESVISRLDVGTAQMEHVISSEQEELQRRISLFRRNRPPQSVEGRTAILVDDGLATGMTAVAAARALRRRKAGRIVLAVPVSSRRTAETIRDEVDEVVALSTPESFFAIGEWYMEFGQTSDEEVIDLLDQLTEGVRSNARDVPDYRDILIPSDGIKLPGDLSIPEGALGAVVFAHGSGSSRLSPRNRAVASYLASFRFATLLFDLLSEEESNDRTNVFDITLLAERLRIATHWLRAQDETAQLPLGYFGASTGAAAALVAATIEKQHVAAVVSRGGRPDLAGRYLSNVEAPTLLIVGGEDREVLRLNQEAQTQLQCDSALEVIAGAGHLFEEPGALEKVTKLAQSWFARHFKSH